MVTPFFLVVRLVSCSKVRPVTLVIEQINLLNNDIGVCLGEVIVAR